MTASDSKNPMQANSPGKTIAEKILSAKSGHDARAGDVVVCALDHLMATDGSMPMTIETEDDLATGAKFLTESPGPRFIQLRVMDGPPSVYKRSLDLVECRLRFRNALMHSDGP